MQSVGATWLMVSLGAGPLLIALTQTASTLPFFILALPAGAIGDIVDRRKLILFTETWMLIVAVTLAALTIAGLMTPVILLALTFALSAGDAVESPTWRALLPELVTREDLPSASALNGIEFNIARSVGPALAGGLIAAVGVGATFVINALSFVGVIVVVARWKRSVRTRTAPAETISGATAAALRYVRHSPDLMVLMFRAGVAMFFASGLLALLPTVARNANPSPIGYGLLLGGFGGGAVAGATLLGPARARWSTNAIVSIGIAITAVVTIATGALHALIPLAFAMVIGGAGWIMFISLINATVQSIAPDWVRARVLAVFLLVSQGALAAGSVVWGGIAQRTNVGTSLLFAGIGAIGAAALGLRFKLPHAGLDVSPWNHWRLPTIADGDTPALDDGPVLVTAEYRVARDVESEFLNAMSEYGRVRQRDGASRWGIYRDTEASDRYVETFVVSSWGEHLRQHDRQTQADRALEERVLGYSSGEVTMRHLIYARVHAHDSAVPSSAQ
jgi:MFS family permease